MAEYPIAVFTGSRAEYGLLRHLVRAIDAEPTLSLQMIVSGSHLSRGHGATINEIEADGIPIAARIPLSLDTIPVPSMAALSAEAMAGVNEALERLLPQMLIVLGDRYESFAAAAAAHLHGIQIVHIHGGEATEGAMDDRLRHAITQLSRWHFTAAEPYRKRVIAMGQPEERVFNVGPMVLDGLLKAPVAERSNFERSTGYRFAEKNLLVTYHPETLLPDRGVAGFEYLLKALEQISCNVLFTNPNADVGGDLLLQLVQTFCESHPRRSWQIPSLGQERYLEALQLFQAMAGNSSSGIIEAPLLGIPVLNIGKRQAGRLRHGHVIEVAPNYKAIYDGLGIVLGEGKWVRQEQIQTANCEPPSSLIVKWIVSEFCQTDNYSQHA
jgi:UDP-hydrolysing UDP-N-acetyl-D-glucosamine 2-epimerase